MRCHSFLLLAAAASALAAKIKTPRTSAAPSLATGIPLPNTEAANNTAAIGTNCDIVSNHTVIAGDGLANIATAANVTLDQVLLVNPQITNPRLINVGDVIAIPNSKCVAPAAKPLAEPTATCVNGTEKTTTVAAGDTLIIIAKEKLGITLPALVAANPQIKDVNKINVGDVINVPLCAATAGAKGNGTESAVPATTATPKKRKFVARVDGRREELRERRKAFGSGS